MYECNDKFLEALDQCRHDAYWQRYNECNNEDASRDCHDWGVDAEVQCFAEDAYPDWIECQRANGFGAANGCGKLQSSPIESLDVGVQSLPLLRGIFSSFFLARPILLEGCDISILARKNNNERFWVGTFGDKCYVGEHHFFLNSVCMKMNRKMLVFGEICFRTLT